MRRKVKPYKKIKKGLRKTSNTLGFSARERKALKSMGADVLTGTAINVLTEVTLVAGKSVADTGKKVVKAVFEKGVDVVKSTASKKISIDIVECECDHETEN